MLTACSDTSNAVVVLSFIETKAGDVYADENPTANEPIDTDKAAKIYSNNFINYRRLTQNYA
jgi:hypothetical protein